MVGQLGNKADGIGKDHIQVVRHGQLPGGGIQGVKEPVVGGDARAGKLIQQRGFARVGVAHNGHHRHGILHPTLPLHATHLAHLLQLLLQPGDPLPDMPPVGFQLGFAGATGADTAALSGQVLAHAGKPGQQVLILGQLHLQSAFLGLGTLGKNIQNQGASVQHRHAHDLFQGPDIAGGQLVVKNYHGGFRSLHQHPHFLGLALADEAVGIRGVAVLQNLGSAEAPCGFQQGFQLFQSFIGSGLRLGEAIGIQAHQHRPLRGYFLKIGFHILPPGFLSSYYTTNHRVLAMLSGRFFQKVPRFSLWVGEFGACAQLRQKIRTALWARDFGANETFEAEDILCVFRCFECAQLRQKIRAADKTYRFSGSQRFFHKSNIPRRRNTLCISRLGICRVVEKDRLSGNRDVLEVANKKQKACTAFAVQA